MSKSAPAFDTSVLNHNQARRHRVPTIPVRALGLALSGFLSITYVLCVLFDLWLPAYAMNPAWSALLPGFVWISWGSFFLGLIETFAYGWYAAGLFALLYNFFINRIDQQEQP